MNGKLYIATCNVGKGLFANTFFKPGDLILTFRGKKDDRNDPIHYRPEGAYLLQTGKYSYIKPTEPGLYINHSCHPNAGLIKNRRLIAIKAIVPGTEIR